MVFSSYIFLFGFLPATLIGFWLISRIDHRASRLWLCLASLVFYGWWDVRWLPVLFASIAFNFLMARVLIGRANAGRANRWPLLAGVGANVAALIYYKYLLAIAGFFGLAGLVPAGHGLPLGISFFTFTQIAFLVDVSEGFHARYSPLNYLLFVTFFPHLIAGPIVHHRDLMPQFEDKRAYHFQPRAFAIGLAMLAMGLAKKTLIADSLSELSLEQIGHGHAGPGAAWIGILAYSMQLYFDFSGYSDMAIGLARMFGIRFPANFDSPYKATNIIDFWQRWHITLTRFLTAYVYNPLALHLVRRRMAAGRSTSKKAQRTVGGFLELIALPTMVTMLIAGAWHGAGLQFVIFGGLHGLYISANHAWRNFGPKPRPLGRWAAMARAAGYGLLVYLAVLLAQIFFRAASTGEAFALLGDLAGLGRAGGGAAPIDPAGLATLGGAILIALLAPNSQQIMADHDPVLDPGPRQEASRMRARLSWPWAVAFGVMLFLGLFSIREGQPFIYFQF